MKKGLLLVALCVFQFGYSQNKLNSKVSLSLFHHLPRTPRWNIDYVYSFNERYALGMQIGYGNYTIMPLKFELIDTRLPFEKDYSLFEIRPELYYSVTPRFKTMQLFASVEFLYIKHSDKLTNYSFKDPNRAGFLYYDSATYNRTKKGVNLNITSDMNINSRFFLQVKTGLGLRLRDVQLSEIVKTDNQSRKEVILLSQYLSEEGKDFGINFQFDIRIGFRF